MKDARLRIAVTGSSGQLGQELQWLAPLYPDMEFTFFSKQDWDIAIESVNELQLSTSQLNVVINCAAYTNVEKAEDDFESASATNSKGPGYLATACKKHGALLIHISTDYVFDGHQHVPYIEEDSVNPMNMYGLSKLHGEQAVDAATNRYYTIRTSWLYSRYGHNFYNTMLRLADERESLRVVDDQIASPTYAKFLAEDILHLIRLKLLDFRPIPFGVYHYTQLGETSWFGFAQEIMRINQKTIQLEAVRSAEFPTKAKRPQYSKLSTRKWEEYTSIALRTWQEGVEACRLSSSSN